MTARYAQLVEYYETMLHGVKDHIDAVEETIYQLELQYARLHFKHNRDIYFEMSAILDAENIKQVDLLVSLLEEERELVNRLSYFRSKYDQAWKAERAREKEEEEGSF